jgi:hypothetical protein
MSDTFEHEKPYSLIAKYQESPAQSVLTAPYDIHATYFKDEIVNLGQLLALLMFHLYLRVTEHQTLISCVG